jgi:myo-inositol-1(or 4)-monophosphatase
MQNKKSDILSFIETLAKDVGEILLSFANKKNLSASRKSDNTFVTEADIAANDFITNSIKINFPEENILSEEGNTKYNPSASATWVIDPLDGTNNFALGLPIWGCSIARIVDGHPQSSALFFPKINELYSAELGKGAFLNQKIIKIDDSKNPLIPVFLTCTRSIKKYMPPPNYKLRILGAAAYDFCAIAAGDASAGMQSTPKIWDIAAGWLILEEAGGHIEVLSEPKAFPLNSNTTYDSQSFKVLSAMSNTEANSLKIDIRPVN